MAAQFESFVHPFVILLTVPLALVGGLGGLLLFGQTLNIFSQVGLVMLVGLATKNGILIVEFINQLRDAGRDFDEAIINGAAFRLRPILMTGFTTVFGAVPLVLSSSVPSAETIDIFAFMSAADESKAKGGAPVSVKELIEKAKQENDAVKVILTL